jgi:hypothetical protein
VAASNWCGRGVVEIARYAFASAIASSVVAAA